MEIKLLVCVLSFITSLLPTGNAQVEDTIEALVRTTAPTPTILIFNEGDSFQVCVSLASAPTNRVEVNIQTVEVTNIAAEAGVDFTAVDAVLVFPALQPPVEECVDISIFEDNRIEQVEGFTINVTTTSSEIFLTGVTLPLSPLITDTSVAIFGFAQPSYDLSEDSNTSVCVVTNTTIDDPISTRVVTLSAMADTADANDDFAQPSIDLTFGSNTPPEGECISPGINDDDNVEDLESYTLSIASGATSPGSDTTIINIIDDDGVNITFNSPMIPLDELDTGANSEVEVCLTVSLPPGALQRNVIVTVTTEDGTANSGVDFEPLNVMLTFSPGNLEMCENVTVFGDNLIEMNETFTVSGMAENIQDMFLNQASITIIDNGDECPSLSNITNGIVTVNGNILGSVATYSCESGFEVEGDEERECQMNGEWSGSEPECVEPAPTTLGTTEDDDDDSNTGRTVGIAVGVSVGGLFIIIILILLIALCVWYVRKRRASQKYTLSYSTMYGNSSQRPTDKPNQPEPEVPLTERGEPHEERGVDIGDDADETDST